jgi:hypothetical protein
MTTESPRPVQPPLPDLPLIREELLVEMEQRHRDGASRTELADLRWHHKQLFGDDDARP